MHLGGVRLHPLFFFISLQTMLSFWFGGSYAQPRNLSIFFQTVALEKHIQGVCVFRLLISNSKATIQHTLINFALFSGCG